MANEQVGDAGNRGSTIADLAETAGPGCAVTPLAQDVTAIAAPAMQQLSKLTRSQPKRANLHSVTPQCR